MDLEQITELVDKSLEKYGLKRTYPVKINNRFKSTLGRVSVAVEENGALKTTLIEFARELVEEADEDEVFSIVCHECAHAISTDLSGESHDHDKYWHDIYISLDPSDRAGSEYYDEDKEDIKKRGTYKYVVRCSKCGRALFYYRRAGKTVKHPEFYRSYCCSAPFKVEQLR